MLRERLTSLEDLETLSRDFALGAQLSLIRRYSAAGRKVKIDINDELRSLLRDKEFGAAAGNLHAVLMEIATNDLKYGIGMSSWRFEKVGGQPPRIGIRLHALSEFTCSAADGGRGKRTIAERIHELDGRIIEGPSIDAEGRFVFHFEVPVPESDDRWV
jgi:two-component system sensor histidine kinase ChiS